MRRTTFGLVVALLAGSVATGCDRSKLFEGNFSGYPVEGELSIPAVRWERPDGHAYDVAKETAGHITLLYFGYTHCPDICPMQLMSIATALNTLGPDTTAMLRVLFVTLDPARDTGVVLTKWLQGFHPAFIPLRATRASVRAELAKLGLAPPARTDTSSIDPAHASAVMVFGRDGRARLLYEAGTNAESWAVDLRRIVNKW